MFMGFVAIAVAIGIDAECHRQAMHIAGYAYAPEICSIKTPKNQLHLTQLIEF
ncbi:hypothetical protein GTQ43_11340 [Nostoc sp. KVJ3]|uniref:hypothetical protein n=1 Tax=Nostoc sp. KVJ3 TaxID=457945 RepID=UPI002238D196|nr:hypothetical protein [Nostoc sp. KVJ3]MCW5314378.1 hypothetical protein [Nostoc sp. KVJ3]